MNGVTGMWALTVRTPIGSIRADMTFTESSDGLSGKAAGKWETVDMRDIAVTQSEKVQRLTWTQSITKPLRLDLHFDVVVVGDEMRGTSRAGRLPRSAVVGHRLQP